MEGDEAARRGREALSGGHLCHVCGHQYPNPNPSAKLRRSHRRNCRKVTLAAEEEDAGARNAGEGRLVLGAAGGPGDGDEPGNGAASGGSASPGSANGGVESVEDKENADHASPNAARIQVITSDCIETGLISNNSSETADEGNGTDLERPCTNGIQHKVPESFTETGSLAVARPTEREDSLEEYQDASSFHQSDPEDGAAVARESDVPMEIKNLDKGSVGSSVAADVISLERYETCKYQFSRESSMTDFPAGSEVENEAEYYVGNITPGLVGCEDGLNLQSTDECSADIVSNNTDVVVDSKSDKTSDSCEFIGDLNPSSLQKCSQLMSDPESQSACSRKVDSFSKDGMEVLDSMSEVLPREEIVESYPIGSEIISNSGDELKLIHTENTSTDCSTERSSQNLSAQDTSGVQLPVDNSCLVNLVCSVPGYQDDLAVTNVDDMLKPMINGAVPGLVFHYALYKVILLLP